MSRSTTLALFVAFGAACAANDERELLDMPEHPQPERGDAGVFDAGPGVSCDSGDGCDVTCPLLDGDCPDGATCAVDGLCTPGCQVFDTDCSRADDGFRCLFGEECESNRCIFVDDEAVCTRACADDAPCANGLECVRRTDKEERICLPTPPASCASARDVDVTVAPSVLLVIMVAKRRRLRRQREASIRRWRSRRC